MVARYSAIIEAVFRPCSSSSRRDPDLSILHFCSNSDTTIAAAVFPLYVSMACFAHCFAQPSTAIVGKDLANMRSPFSPVKKRGRQIVTVFSGRNRSKTRRVAILDKVPSIQFSPLHDTTPIFRGELRIHPSAAGHSR